MVHQSKHGSTAPAPDEERPDERQRQEHAARLEQRLNDPEWRPLAEQIRKKLGDQFTLDLDEVFYLVHGTAGRPRFPWPVPWTCTVSQLLAVLSRHGPKVARRLLDTVLE